MSVRHRVRNNGRKIKHEVDASADHIVDRLKEFGAEAREAAEDQLDQIATAAKGYVKKGRKQAARWERSLEDQVGDRPIMALLAASACGFVLGLFMSRR
jgi:ElaB/YqjD/DUF883 family membrane-anchored ribosome-binding protein